MFCPNCKQEIGNDSIFCPFCGNDINFEKKIIKEKEIFNNNVKNNNSIDVLLNIEYSKLKKKKSIAIFLWLLGGIIGLHRLYIGDWLGILFYQILLYIGIFFLPTNNDINSFYNILRLIILLFDLLILLNINIKNFNYKLKLAMENQEDISELPIHSHGFLVFAIYILFTIIVYFILIFSLIPTLLG